MTRLLRFTLLLINLFVLPYAIFAATGTDCSTAIQVSSNGCSAAGAYNNTGITGTLAAPSCFGAGNNNGMWFQFVASSHTVTASAIGLTLTKPMIALLSPATAPCTGPFTELGCNNPGTDTASLTYSNLTIGNTYYLYVDGENNLTGTFQLCLTSPVTPPNDDPCNAIVIPTNNFCSGSNAYTNYGATGENLTSSGIPACFDATGNLNTVWFQFTATNSGLTVNINGGGTGGLVRPQAAVILPSAGCNGSSFGATNNACAQAAAGSDSITISMNNLVIGNTYYIVVDGEGDNMGSFQICVNNYAVSATIPNDSCDHSTLLCPNEHYYATTSGGVPSGPDWTLWNCNGDVDNIAWFKFTTTNPVQKVNFFINTVCDADYLQFEIFSNSSTNPCTSLSTGWTSVACTEYGPTGTTSLTIPTASLTANTTYWLAVDNWPGDYCNFDFTVTGIQGSYAGTNQYVCKGTPSFNMTGYSPTGGTWSGPGITNATLGTFDPAIAGIGEQTLYYTWNGCTSTKTILVSGPVVTTSNNVTICSGQSTTLIGDTSLNPTNYPVTFTNTTAKTIPDNSNTGVTSTIAVSGINNNSFAANTLVTVNFTITHPNVSDLYVYLECPGGTMILLTGGNGGSGENYYSTTFSTASVNAITSASNSAPYSGTYSPQQLFSLLNACIVNGTWSLIVKDLVSGNKGTLQNWSISFNNQNHIVSYAWSPTTNMTNSGTLSPTVSPTATTTYLLSATDALGCTDTSSVTVTVTSAVTLVMTNDTVCHGAAATLTAAPSLSGGTYTWSPGGATTSSITVSPATTAIYTVTYSTSICPVVTDSATAAIWPPPNASIAAPATLTCAATSVTLTASSTTFGATYKWAGGVTSATKSVSSPGNYTVTVTDPAYGCTSTASVTVSQNITPPNSGVNAPTTLTCTTTSETLTATSTTSGATFNWGAGINTAANTVSGPATYTVTITDPSNGCTSTASATVTQNITAPNAAVTAPTVLTCTNTSETLTASSTTGGATFNWGGGVTTTTKLVTSPATYTVTVTNPANGCTATASATVTQNTTAPNAGVSAPTVLTCTSTSETLTASSTTGGATFNWGGGITTAANTVTAPATYTVTVTNPANGCTSTASATVTQNITAPNAGVVAPGILTCTNTSETITATSTTTGATFNWGGGVTTANKTVTAPATYTVTVTDPSNGCTSTASATVTQNITAPNAAVGAPAILTCINTSETITATSTTGGATFNWGGGVTTANKAISSPATYTVTVTNPANGCTATASATVTQNITPPNAGIAAPTVLTCTNTSETLTATSTTPGATFNWGAGINTAVNTISNPSTYTVTVTDPANGCTSTASVTVTQNITAPNASIAPPTVLTCANTTENLIASSSTAGATFNWGGGNTTTSKTITSPASYMVTVTDPSNGCTSTASATVTQNITAPNAGVGAPGILTCTNTSETITATSTTTGATFNWGGGVTTANKTVTAPATYTVTVTDPSNGCTSTASATVTQNITAPNAAVGAPAILTCINTSETITATSTTGGATFNWGGGVTTANKAISSPATYTVTVTNPANGCTSTASATVTQNITPPNAGIGAPTVLTCTNTSETLTATSTTPGATFNWGAGINTAANTISNPSTYTVTITDPTNGCTSTASVTVTQNITAPNASIAPPTVLTCTNTTENLIASSSTAGATFNWGGGNTTTSKTITSPASYTVTVTDPSNGCTSTASATVTQNITAPSAGVGAPGILTCTNTSETITATSTTTGATFNWGGGVTTANKTVTAPATYTVTVTDPSNGCTSTASATVTQNITAPNAAVGAPAILTCINTSETITATSTTGGATFNWGGGVTTANKTISSPATYTVTVTNPANGCTSTASATVTQNITPPNAGIAAPTVLTCTNTSETLTATSTTPGATFNWGAGINTAANTISNPSTYTVTITDPTNGCTSTASVTVTQNITAPNASIAPPTVLTCTNTTENLIGSSSTAGATFNWGGGNTTTSKTVTSPASYTVTVTDPSNGCTSTASATVTQNITAPNSGVGAPGILTCTNTSETITATSTTTGATFNWGGGVTTANKTVTAPATYTVTVTDPSNGCTSTASVTVSQNITAPNASIIAPATLTCTNTSELITASSTTAGATYNWGGGVTSASETITAAASYTVTVTDPSNGCTSTASTTVSQNITVPNVGISTPTPLTCTSTSETLTASSATAGATFNWGGGVTTANNTVNSPSTYTVTVTDPSNGCTSSSSVTVTQTVTPPNASIAPPVVLTCTNTTQTITASSTTSGATFNWGGGITTATNTISNPSTYTVTVTDPSNSCTSTASVSVSQNIIAPNVGIAPPSVLTCANTTETLIASSSSTGATFNWGGGVITATNTISGPSNYTVTVTDPSNGCTSTASVTVTQNITAPNASIGAPAILTCTNTSVTLTAISTTSGATFNWGGGVTVANKTVTAPANYTVTVTDPSNGCTSTASVTVAQNITSPNAGVVAPTVLTCTNTSQTLTATSTTPGATFTWGAGANTAANNISNPATYTVTVTDPSNGCTSTASVTVAQNTATPNASITAPTVLTCSNTSENLNASSTTAGATFNWGGGNNTASNPVTAPATYTVTVTDPSNGCTITASTTVTQNITPPNAGIGTPGILTCIATSETITASSTTAGAIYNWGGGITTASNIISNPATYTVTVTDPSNGCTSTASTTVTQNIVAPNAGITAPGILTCTVTSETLTAISSTTGATFNWGGGVVTATNIISVPSGYTVTVTDPSNGCTASSSVSVSQNVAAPNVTISLPSVLTCTNTSETLTASSTTGGATFTWGAGINTAVNTISNPGSYSVTSTDPSNGCTASASTTVTQAVNPPNISISLPLVLNCSTTSEILTASSTTAGATYNWGGGITTATNTVTNPGNYTVTATDPSNNCTASASVSVVQNIQPPNAGINPPVVLTCSTVSETLTATSSTTGATFNWGAGVTTAANNISNPAIYVVTVTDPVNGCTSSSSVTVIQNINSPNVSIATPVTLTCSVTSQMLTASSSTLGATFNWGGGVVTATNSISVPSTYAVTVTDPSNGCTASASVTVTQDITHPNSSIAPSTGLTCITTTEVLTASSGTAGATFDWGGGITTPANTISSPGNYTVSVTNPANGCVSSASVLVAQNVTVPNSGISAPVPLTCSTTSEVLTATSTTTGATFNWGGGVNTANNTVNNAGNYSVTVTDPSNGCTASASTTVTETNTVPAASIANPVVLSCSITSQILTASSITTGATFNWGGGNTTATNTITAPGNYAVTVTDPSNGCSSTASVVVTQNIALPDASINPPVILNCTVTSQTLTATSATTGATFNWGGGINTATNTITNPSTYSVTITDPANGCTASATTTVTQNITAPAASISAPTALTCTATSETLTASSVTAGVTFSWNGGATTASIIITNPGNYSVTATDPSNGCTGAASTTVNQSVTPPNAGINTPNVLTCVTTSSTLTATSTTGGVTFNWGNGITTANNNVTNPGNYSVTVTDPSNSCTNTATVTVIQNITPPNSGIAPPVLLTCVTLNEVLTASSSTTGATFDWGGGITTSTNTVSNAGNYTVTVTDPSNGCTGSSTVSVTQNITAPNAGINPPVTLTCSTTSQILEATSTTSGATYNWGGGIIVAGKTISNPGNYQVTVTDPANGCTASASVSVIQNIALPNASVSAPSVLTCTNTTGALTASSTTPSATFNWGGGITTATNTVSNPGTYTVTVTDPSNNCTSSSSATVTQTVTPPNAGIATPAILTCVNTSQTLTASSTTAGATFNWGGGITTTTKTITNPGPYSVTVTDPSNNCTSSASVSVTQSITPPDAGITTPAMLTCTVTSQQLTASSTTSGATFSWGGGVNSATNTFANPGTYAVTVTDPANGCTASVSAVISQNTVAPDVSIAPPSSLNCHASSVTLTASSSTTGANFNWGGGITTSTNSVSATGNYAVTATDPANGCTATASTVVNSILSPALTVNASNVSCFNGSNGSISTNPASGVPPYTFNWSNNQTVSNPTALTVGTYSVTMTDAIGCTVSQSAAITSPPQIQVANTVSNVTCYGLNNGSITVTTSGGTTPYTFNWNNGDNTQSPANLVAGTYYLTVTDQNSCTVSVSAIISQPVLLTVSASATNISCFGNSDGAIQVTPGGGTPAYSFVWNDGNTAQNRTALASGNYSVIVTDQHQCTANASATLNQPVAINITPDVTQPSCPQKGNDGWVSVNATGGDGIYTYLWSTGESTDSIGQLAPGNYSVTVTDHLGCSATASFGLAYLYNFSITTGPSVTIDLGQTIELNYSVNGNAGIISSNIWSPPNSLSCDNCPAPFASPNSTTTYRITVENQLGCAATDTVTIYINPDYTFYIPNAFTPNGDGNNDYFQVFGNLNGINYFEIQIFNRWGEKVFDSHDIYFQWDGTYKGVMQNPQVFVYQVKLGFLDGHVEPLKKGSVTLIR